MKRIVGAACVWIWALAVFSTASLAQPAELFAQLPNIESPRLSPDGRYIATIQPYNDRPAVSIYDRSSPGLAPVVFPSNDWLIDGLIWAKNDRLIVFLKSGRAASHDTMLRTWGRAIVISPDGDDMITLFEKNRSLGYNVSLRVEDVALDDPDHIYMPLYVDRGVTGNLVSELYRVNVRNGETTRVARGTLGTFRWITDGKGQVVARIDESSRPLTHHVFVRDGEDWREVAAYPAAGDQGSGIFGLSEDGEAFVQGVLKDRRKSLARVPVAAKGNPALLHSDSGYDTGPVLFDEWTNRVIGTVTITDRPVSIYFDPARQRLQKGLQSAFPGMTVIAESWSRDQTKVIVRVEDSASPPGYYMVDRTRGAADPIGTAYVGLEPDGLAEMKPWSYVARDGLAIPAYLTLPRTGGTRNLPVVVMPHGGPDARDYIRFDWWAQFLASRGYAVFQPNFRGSSGYGRGFTDAGLRQWGLKMQDDLTDGVAKLIADGIADPRRICIVGASYGGYAALAGATLTPDLYACAISVAGVSDLPQIIAYERKRYGRQSKAVSFWISRIGSTSDDSDQLRATSPARLANRVKAPILLLHPELDTTVPIEQSERMAKALQAAGRQVSFVRLPGDDHGLDRQSSRLRVLQETERFLASHIGR